MARIQRPGEADPVEESDPRRKRQSSNRNRNSNSNNTPNRPGGPGKKKKKSISKSGPITDISGGPTVFDPGSAYGRTGDPFLNTPQGIRHANDNPQDYFNYVTGMAGLGSPLQSPGWNNFLNNTAYTQTQEGYGRALLKNNELGFTQYMQTLGVPQNATNYGMGAMNPMGTGQPVDTGNPFTSSSGNGITPAPVTTPAPPVAPNPLGGAGRKVGGRKGKKQRPGGAQGLNKINPPSGAGATATDLGGYAAMLRKQFLSMSPELRGETELGGAAIPGRWSPWG